MVHVHVHKGYGTSLGRGCGHDHPLHETFILHNMCGPLVLGVKDVGGQEW